MQKARIPLLTGITLALFMTVYAQTTNNAFGQLSPTPTFHNIDISTTPNTSDFPFGICSDGTYRYMTLHAQGSLVKILISDNTYTIFDNDAVAAGQDWYSCVVASGKIFINEKDSGLTRIFNPSTNTYSPSISIPANIDDAELDYIDGYATAPHKFRAIDSGNLYTFSCGSFGELRFTNGYVWQPFDCTFDFSAVDNANGVIDYSFHGIVRIDPVTNAVTRYSIAGATALRGSSVDVTDSTILWFTDAGTNKLYRFNTNTGLVTNTIDLPVGTNPRGLANDSTTVYIAENDQGGVGITAKILKVQKSDFTTSQIDTTASIPAGKSGTFTVYVALGSVVWTDQANHVGFVRISDSQTTVVSTTGTTDSNHFGLLEGSNFIFAGKGSVVQGSISLASSKSSSGGSCKGDCYSPHLGTDENGRLFYEDSITINGKTLQIKNELHSHSGEIIKLPVGQPVSIILKGQDSYPDNMNNCEVAIGIKKGHFIKQDATFIIGIWRSFDEKISTYYEGDESAYRDASAEMYNKDNNIYCEFIFTPTKHLLNDMFAIELKDIHGYTGTYFINEGMIFKGMSEIGTPIFDYQDKDGKIYKLTILDQTLEDLTKAKDHYGNTWTGDFGKFWSKDYVRPFNTCQVTERGYERDCPEFKMIKYEQELIARQLFDSSLIQKVVPEAFSPEFVNYGRLHDPVPNMMKAQTDLAIKNLTKMVK